MGLFDSLRDRFSGRRDDDDYYDDDYYDNYDEYEDEPQDDDSGRGTGLLGNSRRPEAESVSVYTRSGRPVDSNGAGGAETASYGQGDTAAGSYASRTSGYDDGTAYDGYRDSRDADLPGNSAGGGAGLRAVPRQATSGKLPPYVLKPVSYDDVQMVVRRVRTNQPVVLVLTNTNLEVAKRILDFTLGLSCGVGGQVDELGERVFVITPEGVELSDQDINKLVHDGIIER